MKKPSNQPTVFIGLRVPPKVKARLLKIAVADHRRLSQVVMLALEQYLAEHEQREVA